MATSPNALLRSQQARLSELKLKSSVCSLPSLLDAVKNTQAGMEQSETSQNNPSFEMAVTFTLVIGLTQLGMVWCSCA